jgi:hypothetical protein
MLDRRSLLKLSAAGVATLGTGIRVAHAQDKPRRGGTLTIGRNHDADTLYPGRSTGLSAIATNLLLYDGLVLHDFQMKIRPAARGLKYYPIHGIYKLMDAWVV